MPPSPAAPVVVSPPCNIATATLNQLDKLDETSLKFLHPHNLITFHETSSTCHFIIIWVIFVVKSFPIITRLDCNNGRFLSDLRIIHIYRPQTKFAKVMFLHLFVSHSVQGGGVCPSACWDTTPDQRQTPPPQDQRQAHPPKSRHPPGPDTLPFVVQCMLGDTGNKWAVRILLECTLVNSYFLNKD